VLKSEPSRRRTAMDLEMKIRIVCKYDLVPCLPEIVRERGFPVLVVNTISKDAARIKEHVKSKIVWGHVRHTHTES
jgi:hypothetical protein